MSEKEKVVMIERNAVPFCEPVSETSASSQNSLRQIPPPPRANPAPLGLMSFGTGFLCASLINLRAGSVHTPNIVVVFMMFYGGLSQSLVGWWEMYLGNTFSATAFASFGAFNFTYGAIFLPSMGLISAYSVDGVVTEEFSRAVGIFLACWSVVAAIFLVGALRTNLPLVFTIGMTMMAFIVLSAHNFTGRQSLATAGGVFGIFAACGAFYGAISGFYSRKSTFEVIRLPPIALAYNDV